jgi:predicted DCC family thiol-disulfide oxidoreductase YuxK
MFHDGGCPLCEKEVMFYRTLVRRAGADVCSLRFCDINTPDGEAALARLGVGLQEGLAALHVRDAQGALHTGRAGFVVMFEALPGRFWNLTARFLKLPWVSPLVNFGYAHFARVRLDFTGRSGVGGSCRAPTAASDGRTSKTETKASPR